MCHIHIVVYRIEPQSLNSERDRESKLCSRANFTKNESRETMVNNFYRQSCAIINYRFERTIVTRALRQDAFLLFELDLCPKRVHELNV